MEDDSALLYRLSAQQRLFRLGETIRRKLDKGTLMTLPRNSTSMEVSGKWYGPGGGGTLIFSAYVGSDPASALHPQKISGISSTPKKYLKF